VVAVFAQFPNGIRLVPNDLDFEVTWDLFPRFLGNFAGCGCVLSIRLLGCGLTGAGNLLCGQAGWKLNVQLEVSFRSGLVERMPNVLQVKSFSTKVAVFAAKIWRVEMDFQPIVCWNLGPDCDSDVRAMA
jgi:hypothetical protein